MRDPSQALIQEQETKPAVTDIGLIMQSSLQERNLRCQQEAWDFARLPSLHGPPPLPAVDQQRRRVIVGRPYGETQVLKQLALNSLAGPQPEQEAPSQ